ncbi:restriction endonuclease subunit S [Empedobacter falsenii]|uniref:restriction endonuclease subunit S n=1 Tax=Empedobacter falsenii TaxID=343874 RepID=UPI001C596A4E|nr:restriction endonuclease subunit S [Empedobacter falsenii]MBW1619698.1 restriction endonuclease subunit S [Empedobacter falsenii]
MSKLEELLQGVDVEWKALGDISEIYGGLKGKNKSDFTDGNAKYVTYKNIYNNIEVDLEALEMVKVSSNENQYEVKYGDVLFTGSSENASEAGISSAVTFNSEAKVFLNSFSFGLRFKSEIKILPEFSKYLFRSKSIRDEIIKTASGVTRYNVSKKRFVKIKIPIPCPDNPEKSLEIQQEIVRVLDELTSLTNQLTTELETERQNRKKQFEFFREQLFRFEEGELDLVKLGDLCKIASGKNKDKSDNGKYILYGSTGIIGKTDVKKFDSERILVARVGANAGFVYIADGEYDVSDNALVIEKSEKVLTKFLYYFLFNMNLNQFAKGAGQPLITGTFLKNIYISIPSQEEQECIVKLLDQFDATHTAIEEEISKEIKLRTQQYEYYREKLLSFPQN